eukprot:TRINITY_DN9920_c0_g2_i1.p1 TRINITY_DN9920_c0_g2~~TRINITY_DN9920_c0_g2_i1.p1  ORF type:complete len:441 (-),score=57.60 TRINITY_DN9920_c0_g2_i1:52-1326(-)
MRTIISRDGDDALKVADCSSQGSGESSDESDHILSQALTKSILEIEAESSVTIKQNTIYSAAIVIPQVARTVGWSKTMMILVIRSYLFLALNYFLQFSLVYFIFDELNLLSRFAGRPSLCNFGSSMWRCPTGEDCVGPGGTVFQPEQLYPFNVWQTRGFVRDSLLSLFPERADEISSHVQPGEYGVESYFCRMFCCFIFCIVVMEDLYELWSFVKLLYYLPGRAEDWAQYENQRSVKFTFTLAGMPGPWKAINLIVIFFPRLLLFKSVTYCGINFLMETSDITSMIVNTTAISFLLQIDELIFSHFLNKSEQHILEHLQEFDHGFDRPGFDRPTHDESEDDGSLVFRRRDFVRLVPWRMIFTVTALFAFLCEYYHAHCQREDDGSWVSAPLYLPESVVYNPMCLLVDCRREGAKLIWQMPSTEG